MRLEDHMNAAVSTLPGGGEGGADLGGMVAVIVDHRDSVHPTFELEATVYAGKVRQTLADLVDLYVESDANGNSGGGITNVVLPGNLQMELAEIALVILHPEAA